MNTNKPVTLRPGLLVSLRTTIRGGVEYRRVDLDSGTEAAPVDVEAAGTEATPPPDVSVARWETTRIVTDATDYERAKKTRAKASSLIRGACTLSAFGLVCPGADEGKLDAAYAEAMALVDAHNAQANSCRVDVGMLKGHIAQSDELAAKAVAGEVRDLIDAMKDGLAKADVKAIREAANKARQLGQLLDEGTAAKVSKAVEEARSAAKAIVKRVETEGEDAALVIQELSRKHLNEARFMFLDTDGEDVKATPSATPAKKVETDGDAAPKAPTKAKARQMDFADADDTSPGKKVTNAPARDLEVV